MNMNIEDRLKRAMLKMQVYRDEHPNSRTHQKVILDINFTENFIFGRETTEEERKKLKEIWYGKERRNER